jgi:hypothetical protein
LLAFCQWGEGQVTQAQRWTIDGDGRVVSANGSMCLERGGGAGFDEDSLDLQPCADGRTQLFETDRVNETLAQIRVPTSDGNDEGEESCVGTDGLRCESNERRQTLRRFLLETNQLPRPAWDEHEND